MKPQNHPKPSRMLFLGACMLLLGTATTTIAAGDKATAPSSLYERLGGVYSIATVVDHFIERLLVNDTLNANPAIDAARTTVPKAGLKYRVTSMVSQATGGPEQYHGRSMPDAHRHLNITEQEWQAMSADFKITLAEFKVPEAEQRELFSIMESLKPQIVLSK